MVAKAAPPRVDRRSVIAKALYDCIAEQGYASTTLADVAARAGMTPSHVGYYFDNKAAILEYFAGSVYERVSERAPGLRDRDTGTVIDRLASFRFGEGQMSTRFLGVIQEFSGLAVHDARFHEIKSQHVADWQKYFERLFEGVQPAGGLTAREAGALAHAIAVGLDTNTLFDPNLSREDARRLFRQALRMLAGLDENDTSEPTDPEGGAP